MIDSMRPLRKAVWDTLKASVIYKGDPVSVYDEKVYSGSRPNLYIILSTQQETPGPDQSDCGSMVNSSIEVEVVSRTQSEVSKDAIDEVSDQIYELLEPGYGVPGFTIGSGLAVQRFTRENAITITFDITPTQSILRKIIKFNSLITQTN